MGHHVSIPLQLCFLSSTVLEISMSNNGAQLKQFNNLG